VNIDRDSYSVGVNALTSVYNNTGMDTSAAGKRALDDESSEVENATKRLKTDSHDQLSSLESIVIPQSKDPNNWKRLPSIAYELLALLKTKKFSVTNTKNEKRVNKIIVTVIRITDYRFINLLCMYVRPSLFGFDILIFNS